MVEGRNKAFSVLKKLLVSLFLFPFLYRPAFRLHSTLHFDHNLVHAVRRSRHERGLVGAIHAAVLAVAPGKFFFALELLPAGR